MFRSIANTLGNCFKIPELKSRILFTLGLLAVLLCLGQGAYFANSWLHPEGQFPGITDRLVLIDNHLLYYFVAVTVMTAGTMLLMWLGEQISERGIGNGVSLIITVGILARLPQAVQALIEMFSSH